MPWKVLVECSGYMIQHTANKHRSGNCHTCSHMPHDSVLLTAVMDGMCVCVVCKILPIHKILSAASAFEAADVPHAPQSLEVDVTPQYLLAAGPAAHWFCSKKGDGMSCMQTKTCACIVGEVPTDTECVDSAEAKAEVQASSAEPYRIKSARTRGLN